MSSSLVYVGMDIAKATLDLFVPSQTQPQVRQFPNTPQGHTQLVAWLGPFGSVQVLCEATAGYERAILRCFHAHGIAVSCLNPRHVRHFARAQGRLAKTDRLMLKSCPLSVPVCNLPLNARRPQNNARWPNSWSAAVNSRSWFRPNAIAWSSPNTLVSVANSRPICARFNANCIKSIDG